MARPSLLPGAPTGEALKQELRLTRTGSLDRKNTERAYANLRAEADTWQARRTDYAMARLARGRHPDSDPAFWKDFRDTPAPSLTGSWLWERTAHWRGPSGLFRLMVGIFWTTIALAGALVIVRWRRAAYRGRSSGSRRGTGPGSAGDSG